MEKAFKYRVYPTEIQRAIIIRTFGCTRFVYNYYMNMRRSMHMLGKGTPTYIDMVKDLSDLKKQYPWLKKIDSRALQNTLKDLELAYKKFFAHTFTRSVGKGYPHYKNKNVSKQSYKTTCNNNSIRQMGEFIKLPKLGMLRTRGYLPVEGRILNATVSCEPDGKYYVSLCCTEVECDKKESTGKRIFIEHGGEDCFAQIYLINDFNTRIFLRDVPFQENIVNSMRRYEQLLRQMRRSKEGSRRRLKLVAKQKNLKTKMFFRQMDFLQQLSTELVSEYDHIEFGESPPYVKGKLLYARWSQFKRMIQYKLSWYKVMDKDK